MARPTSSPAGAPFPAGPGAGRAPALPRDPGRATELLYKRHGTTVFRYAWHLLGRREDAEDASQATFLAVHRALGSGAAVLEPAAWVLRIARNECLGRLRQGARAPSPGALDVLEPVAPAGVERVAEVRDQMRVARDTLRGLPMAEREAFVLREWLGLGTAEVALAMSLTPGQIDALAARARRSLALAVGGLEPAAGCADTRVALESGSVGRAGSVHLLRCPVCRGVRRALRPPEATVGTRLPIAVIGERLADALPGFASGGGGIVAVLTAKAAAAPLLAKTAALVAAAVVTAGVAHQEIRGAAASRRASTVVPARGGTARPPVQTLSPATATAPSVRLLSAPPRTGHRRTQVVAPRVPAGSARARGSVASGGRELATSTVSSTGRREPDAKHDGATDGSSGGGGSGDRSDGGDRGDSGDRGTSAPAVKKGADGGHGEHTSTTPAATDTSDGGGHAPDSGGSGGKGSSDGGADRASGDGAPATPDDGGDNGSTSGGGGADTITTGAVGTAPGADDGSDAQRTGRGGEGRAGSPVPVVTTPDPAALPAVGDG